MKTKLDIATGETGKVFVHLLALAQLLTLESALYGLSNDVLCITCQIRSHNVASFKTTTIFESTHRASCAV